MLDDGVVEAVQKTSIKLGLSFPLSNLNAIYFAQRYGLQHAWHYYASQGVLYIVTAQTPIGVQPVALLELPSK